MVPGPRNRLKSPGSPRRSIPCEGRRADAICQSSRKAERGQAQRTTAMGMRSKTGRGGWSPPGRPPRHCRPRTTRSSCSPSRAGAFGARSYDRTVTGSFRSKWSLTDPGYGNPSIISAYLLHIHEAHFRSIRRCF